jgi:protein arginine kinase
MADIREPLPAWVSEQGWGSSVILSTRARLARNLDDLPFPQQASEGELKAASRRLLPIAEIHEKGLPSLRPVEINKLDDRAKTALVDSHLISVQLAAAGAHRWALVDDRHTVSVMVNEEDHLRLQAILPGLQLDAAYKIADQLDDWFAGHLTYATHPSYGYLTSSLANCGTGLRLSVMAHLPALALAGDLEEALTAAQTLGATVRGLYGEDSGAEGNIYQISNGISIGLTERQILARLSASVTYLLTEEESARELLSRCRRSFLEEKIIAAQEELKCANQLSVQAAMRLLSLLRLGEYIGIATGMTGCAFNQLLASMRIGTPLLPGCDARSVFYEETRRPALMRTMLRAQR